MGFGYLRFLKRQRPEDAFAERVMVRLPRVDYVGVTDLETHLFRRWDDIEAVCGPFTIEAGHAPVRYRLDRWLSAAEVARLESEFPAPAWGPD